MGTIGGSELIIVLVIVMVLFGASTIPKLAKSLGQAKREFESGVKEAEKKTALTNKDNSDTTSSDSIHKDTDR
ncbi:hypothetical protein COTS27_01473 [Spirochaetota bacterium]|nr:hypothetical protein COTS27_01473 [Spirochaetota bacterium]